MPRGKELEQLPMANTLPGAGKDPSKFRRTSLKGMTETYNQHPLLSKNGEENNNRM